MNHEVEHPSVKQAESLRVEKESEMEGGVGDRSAPRK